LHVIGQAVAIPGSWQSAWVKSRHKSKSVDWLLHVEHVGPVHGWLHSHAHFSVDQTDAFSQFSWVHVVDTGVCLGLIEVAGDIVVAAAHKPHLLGHALIICQRFILNYPKLYKNFKKITVLDKIQSALNRWKKLTKSRIGQYAC
jgi:hypothetical protein